MDTNNYSSKRIAKNTIMLYIRMLVMMIVTFYTTRLLLLYLGVVDYGIYDILNGVIVLFSFVSVAMSSATQRFIASEIGRKDYKKAKDAFNASFYIYLIIIIISIFLFETIGVWYINNVMNIPAERINTANYVFQLVIIQFALLTIRIPYNASVIANEKMSFFAYISVLEAVLSLLLVFFLKITNGDKLIVYSVLLVFSKAVILIIYILFCNKKFAYCRLTNIRSINKNTYKEISSFSSWSIFGSFSTVANTQGTNLIINFFNGVVVNASVGVANQLTMGLYNLVSNLQTSFNPQLIKLYASGEYSLFRLLLYRNSKFAFFLFLYILIPLFLCTESLLNLWLSKEYIYANEFCKCMLLYLSIEAIGYPLTIAIQAVGKIKNYQLIVSLIFLSIIPIGYIILANGYSPVYIFIVRIFQNICVVAFRMFYLKRIFDFHIRDFFKNVIFRGIVVLLLALPIPIMVYYLFGNGLLGLILVTLSSILSISLATYYFGLTNEERVSILTKIKSHLI